ncbi:hypothetical protein NKH48_17535 [Mesorhizobium sp. M1233]|uniref:LysM peptidoglycan-binding domain-containing protein n=1 Tax=Mesorhizobium sp. M1233 TaxID=2957072 RepID=UPI00333D2C87
MTVKSRYVETQTFAPDPRGNSTFGGVRPREIGAATGVVEHMVVSGDRLDRIAAHYYDNDRFWYRLADANFAELYPPDLLFDPGPGFDSGTDPLGRSDRVGQVVLVPRVKE